MTTFECTVCEREFGLSEKWHGDDVDRSVCHACASADDLHKVYNEDNDYTFWFKYKSVTVLHEDMDGWRQVAILHVDPAVYAHKDRDAMLQEHFTDHSWCGHEHDCCGCVRQTAGEVIDLGEDVVLIHVTGARNI